MNTVIMCNYFEDSKDNFDTKWLEYQMVSSSAEMRDKIRWPLNYKISN